MKAVEPLPEEPLIDASPGAANGKTSPNVLYVFLSSSYKVFFFSVSVSAFQAS
jgi:hypothetical protein